jgi:hypothetical protein
MSVHSRPFGCPRDLGGTGRGGQQRRTYTSSVDVRTTICREESSSLRLCSLSLDLAARTHLNSSTRIMAKYFLNMVQPAVVGPTASSRGNHAEDGWE